VSSAQVSIYLVVLIQVHCNSGNEGVLLVSMMAGVLNGAEDDMRLRVIIFLALS